MNHRKVIILILVCISETLSCHSQRWHNFKTTYKLLPWNGFYSQPKLMSTAIRKGWLQVGSCNQSDRTYPGERFIRNVKYNNIILIYDINGKIAGIQSVVEKRFDNNPFRNYENDSMYQHYRFDDGYEVYVTTAYFVDPEIICDGGRSKEDFAIEGTGNTLIFQNEALTLKEKWNIHRCFINMGLHFNKWGYDESENCSGILVKFKGDRYEHPPSIFLSFMYRQPPSCLYKAQQTIGLSYMHVYFLSPYTLCILSNV
ncbi:unnamed protein product [Lepeophtheirus salmonis]|uniref:(salmon louse) hypothetical protein n=1 Tax=Lepeophtheirus salmonis TaxID=72036 RepID=A0A7R8H851_LEPSM|nr:unnamed protein product [Lepeophtheirus salmonis]CAF2923626.1 unnamed protein product [Lepeophtheirus salmonis]